MNLLTTGEIAKLLNVDRDAVAYALRKLRVKPEGRAGHVRVFAETAVPAVQSFLKSKRKCRITKCRGGQSANTDHEKRGEVKDALDNA